MFKKLKQKHQQCPRDLEFLKTKHVTVAQCTQTHTLESIANNPGECYYVAGKCITDKDGKVKVERTISNKDYGALIFTQKYTDAEGVQYHFLHLSYMGEQCPHEENIKEDVMQQLRRIVICRSLYLYLFYF